MSRRVGLWAAFVAVHLLVSVAGFVLPNEPMGDVYRVYEPWSVEALTGGPVVGIDSVWVYPQLALAPMVLAHAFGVLGVGYTVSWALLVAVVDAVAFGMLVGDARARGRVAAASFWLVSILALGPVGIYRLDAITTPLAIVGGLWLVGRPWVGAMLLAAATWIKVWPAALLAAAVIALRRRAAVVGGALAVSILIAAAVVGAGGTRFLFGFVSDQATRGLQVEAPVATPYLWGALRGAEGFWVYYSQELLTFEVTGTQIDVAITAMTPVLAIVLLAVAVLGAVQVRRGVRFASLFPPLALALVSALIVCNKVGSPQYLCWIVPPIVIGLVLRRGEWWAPAALAVVLALLTQAVYPFLYAGITVPSIVPVLVLTARNALFVVLLVWMVLRVAVARPHRPVSVS